MALLRGEMAKSLGAAMAVLVVHVDDPDRVMRHRASPPWEVEDEGVRLPQGRVRRAGVQIGGQVTKADGESREISAVEIETRMIAGNGGSDLRLEPVALSLRRVTAATS